MKFRECAIAAVCALSLVGCTIGPDLKGTIVANVKTETAGDSIIIQGLKASKFNFAEAKRIGALKPDDPAEACVDSVLVSLGVGGEVPQQFDPQVVDVISAGSVAYILARQLEAQQRSPGLQLSFDCKALIGQIVIDAGKVTAKAGSDFLPGGRVLTILNRINN